ncbi:MAG TPA: hypothetical protein VHT93_07240 [Pseudolabrys sp.]|jgi:hypothetical protein|nr:hypothetical protein [Pseudolabrys sp.]
MFSNSHESRARAPQRCPVCNGQFGLVRQYAWRTGVCSKACRDRARGRSIGRIVLGWFALLPPANEELVPVAALIPVRRDGRDGRLIAARWRCD